MKGTAFVLDFPKCGVVVPGEVAIVLILFLELKKKIKNSSIIYGTLILFIYLHV